MDMFLKMYNVKMLVSFQKEMGRRREMLLEAPVLSKHNLFMCVQSGCGNLLCATMRLFQSYKVMR